MESLQRRLAAELEHPQESKANLQQKLLKGFKKSDDLERIRFNVETNHRLLTLASDLLKQVQDYKSVSFALNKAEVEFNTKGVIVSDDSRFLLIIWD